MELPLFPLDMVLLPHRRVPLHIFEERYKQMIGECLDNDTEFGLVWGTDDDFNDIGCAARVVGLLNRFPDGRMNILIEGTRRFRVIQQYDIHPYISGFVEDVEDDDEAFDVALGNRAKKLYSEAMKLSSGWISPQIPAMELGVRSPTSSHQTSPYPSTNSKHFWKAPHPTNASKPCPTRSKNHSSPSAK